MINYSSMDYKDYSNLYKVINFNRPLLYYNYLVHILLVIFDFVNPLPIHLFSYPCLFLLAQAHFLLLVAFVLFLFDHLLHFLHFFRFVYLIRMHMSYILVDVLMGVLMDVLMGVLVGVLVGVLMGVRMLLHIFNDHMDHYNEDDHNIYQMDYFLTETRIIYNLMDGHN